MFFFFVICLLKFVSNIFFYKYGIYILRFINLFFLKLIIFDMCNVYVLKIFGEEILLKYLDLYINL